MALTQVDQGLLSSTAQYTGFKNRIINGAMVIDQRNAGASVTPTNSQYLTDRFYAGLTQASKFTAQQSSTAPAGFTKSLLLTSSSAYSVVASDIFYVAQGIEGFNVADLGWGAAGASTVTISFWVRSSLTGTFGGSIFNASANRSYPFSYTISAANTFEQKTVTIAGDTSGTWATNNTAGMYLAFGIGVGSTYSTTAGAWAAGLYLAPTGATSVVGTNGATFYITGVQLEKGSTATSFDYRPYGTELQLCQRYCIVYRQADGINLGTGMSWLNTTNAYIFHSFPVPLRVAPTGLNTSLAANYLGNGTNTNMTVTTFTFTNSSTTTGRIQVTGTGGTSGQPMFLQGSNSSAYLEYTGMEL